MAGENTCHQQCCDFYERTGVSKDPKPERPGTRRRATLRGIVHDYMHAFSVHDFDLDEVSDWAVRTGRYQRPPLSMVQQCKRELARTCREEYYTDPQHREVRSLHPVRIKDGDKQMIIWA